ncbi:hypothetical protein OO013_08365 [Mangrovivirga sp. M17]|uniref:Baseplate protein J-like domain-containing protein n=1 Tax=Mangrovivirga halotolerans TaxID=2993936 RepID=A0ABT3RQ05_9BACT|nr:hypothetical protein [Mangrovivirga halotolerans]MCX2743876.1 hypothetical protein [Mangrovivirga halotolerans]
MAKKCDQSNPFKHSGTSQSDRYISSLYPENVKVDGRDIKDIIVFAKKYSQFIKYYDPKNFPDNNWEAYFENDPSAIFASIINTPKSIYFDFHKSLIIFLESDKSADLTILKSHYKLFIYLPIILIKEISNHYGLLVGTHPLKAFISNQFDRDLKLALERIIANYKGAINQNVVDGGAIDVNNFTLPGSITIPDEVLSEIEGMTSISDLDLNEKFVSEVLLSDWTSFYNGIPADEDPFLEGTTIYEKIYDALNYSLLSGQINKIYAGVENLILEAIKYFEQSLEDNQEHKPDYALFLSFVHLFKINQNQLNQLTKRHLDYYYREILSLSPKNAEPQKAYVTIELAKNVSEYLLKSGTLFKNGKDDLGNDVHFKSEQDIVINKAVVKNLKSFYQPEIKSSPTNFLIPYSAENVKTSDGIDEPLKDKQTSWPAFGPLTSGGEPSMPFARLGFAIADKKLFLTQGKRTIVVAAELTLNAGIEDLKGLFKVRLTGEKKWIELGSNEKSEVQVILFGTVLFTIITIKAEEEPVMSFNTEIHERDYETSYPVLEYVFDFDKKELNENLFKRYTELKKMKFKNISIFSVVENVKDFILQNDNGIVDISKPFNLFGSLPTEGSSFIIGSNELNSKPLQWLGLDLKYKEQYGQFSYYTKVNPDNFKWKFSYLKNGVWEGDTFADRDMFTNSNLYTASQNHALLLNNLDEISVDDKLSSENKPYTNAASNGYFKFSLGRGFGHDDYLDAKTLALIGKAGGSSYTVPTNVNATNQIPKKPYDAVVNDFKLSYETTIDEVQQIFHLYPFGETTVTKSNQEFLIPNIENEGELYIGIENLKPPQKISLLFQLDEGSSNPLKLPTKVSWHYLVRNEWIKFDEQDIDDKTNNLTGTGLVGLSFPGNADTKHDILDNSFHWIKLSVEKDSDSLNNIISINAQAVQVSFDNQNNDPLFPGKIVSEGEISKLKLSNSSVKKVSQPYDSFDGRAIETDEQFYVRVSERLRHKDRAVTIWDYEKLILQEFPEIYRAKCITHTEVCRDDQNNIIADNEIKPGHVLVVTVPDLTDSQLKNSLRPYTKKSTLVKVREFLSSRISPFVQLEVQNPKFEEIQVDFKVSFMPEIGDIQFYTTLLNQSIIEFLSPWAFNNNAEISFGGKIHKSAIINFIEEQEHVDYVKDFKMYHKKDVSIIDSDWNKVDHEVIESSVSRTIFVSHETHIINEI